MLELVSLNGNVVSDDNGQLFHHTHALFTYKKDGEHRIAGGHLKSTTVLYTAEIELRPTIGGSIGSLTAMHTVRHKTRHWYFVIGIPLIFVLQCILFVFILKKIG